MKGLILKDLLNMRKNVKLLLLFLVFYGFLSYTNGDSTLLLFMVGLFISMSVITSITEDETANWDRFALTMPISRNTMVKSKYVLSMLILFLGIIPATLLSYLIMNLSGVIDVTRLLLTSYGAFAMSLTFISISIPLIHKYGVEKTRFLVFAIVGIPVGVGFIFQTVGIPLPSKEQVSILLKISPIILLLILIASIFTSHKIYRHKDI